MFCRIVLVLTLFSATSAHADAAADADAALAVVNAWGDALRHHDADAGLPLWSEDFVNPYDASLAGGEGVRAAYGWMLGERIGWIRLSLEEAGVTIDADTAVISPVVVATGWRTSECEYVLVRDGGRWLILRSERGKDRPIETAVDGLGREYTDLTEQWVARTMSWADSVLRANPPDEGDRDLRRLALLKLDEPLHLMSAASFQPIQDFYRDRVARAVDQIESEQVTDGATIWKFYNHGFVVRTPNHTWAHDLVLPSFDMPEGELDRVLAHVDALFVSHFHGDHADPVVIRRALELGIPVVMAPLEEPGDAGSAEYRKQIFAELGSPDSVSTPEGLHIVPLGGSGALGDLTYDAYPGHQSSAPNNVWVVEADGFSTLHFGDQDQQVPEDLEWIDRVHEEREIDVFFPNVWTDHFDRVIRGIGARIVIPGHENELGHSFEHREPYDQAFERLQRNRLRIPEWHVMAWGERVHVAAD